METCISNLLLEYIFSLIFTREFIVARVWAGGTRATPLLLAAHFAKRNTKFGGGKRGRAKIPSPNPLHFCPPERSVWRAKRAVSSVQKRFGFRQTNAPERKLQVRARRLASLGGSRVLYFRLKTEFAISFEGKKNF
jgi:hypothetical protein